MRDMIINRYTDETCVPLSWLIDLVDQCLGVPNNLLDPSSFT